MDVVNTDRLEKTLVLRAPRARVWRALTDAGEFGAWFGVALEGAFAVGERIKGKITTPGYEHVPMEVTVARMEPEHRFAFHWHPYAIDPAVDYATEPMTLVEIRLDEEAGGTRITVVESGFDRLPAARRVAAFQANGNGWAAQLENIARHVAG